MPAHMTRRKLIVRLAGWLFGLTGSIFPVTEKSYAEKVLRNYPKEAPMKLPRPQVISAGNWHAPPFSRPGWHRRH